MEYRDLFIGVVVAFIISFGLYMWMDNMNSAYVPLGGTAVNLDFYSGATPIYGNVSTMSKTSGATLQSSGTSSTNSDATLARSQTMFGTLIDMFKFIPNGITFAASYIGIPGVYVDVAIWTFIFIFVLTLAYILIQRSY